MYASKRTYPEISFPVVYLASKYNKATEDDNGKAMRIAEYIVGGGDEHSVAGNGCGLVTRMCKLGYSRLPYTATVSK